jgi:hypothetical protein
MGGMMRNMTNTFERALGLGHAAYFAGTGLWSLLGIKSFQKATGPKADVWLVKTVGVLVIPIGVAIGMASWRGSREPEIPALAIGSAAGLAAIDIVYVARGRISPVYLLDASAEIALIAGWTTALLARRVPALPDATESPPVTRAR